ncbi:MAG: sodium-dependent bicarbonate transport family permease [Betaproteobacteria bacterium]|nr:sodium-dependent bicarbonate transport family permease [Betaproteobacteria bacterium]
MDVVVYFFILGVLARLVRSDLRLPGALYETLSIYLLLAIGLKGGLEMARQPVAGLVPQIAAVLALGVLVPLVAFPVLRRLGRFNAYDAGALAAHYGSVSVVTFAVGVAYLADRGIAYDPHLPLFVALLEAPGIVVGVLLAHLATAHRADLGPATREVLLGKSVLLLVGGLAIGWIAGPQRIGEIEALFFGLFKGVLALFLVELGLVVGDRLRDLRRASAFLVGFGVLMPVVAGTAGVLTGVAIGLTPGGAALLGTLAGSASYIAAPAAVRIALPQANPALALTAALGVTFPFNITLGIPLYLATAQYLEAYTR